MGKKLFPSPSYIADLESRAQPFSPHEPWFPWIVPFFAITNITVFILTMYINNCPSSRSYKDCIFHRSLGRFSFQPFSENPLFGPSSSTLVLLGALDWKKVVIEGQGWRLITCMWLHAGVIHLVANMLSLLFIGIRLEQEFGFARIGPLYLLSGFGGSLLSSLYLDLNISVGASGALFGLLGAMLSEIITNWTIYANKCAALLSLLFIIGINLAVGFLPHVDSSAHIGGFITGFLLGFILLIRPQYGWVSHNKMPIGSNIEHMKPKYKTYQYILFFTSFIFLTLGFAAALIELFGIGPSMP